MFLKRFFSHWRHLSAALALAAGAAQAGPAEDRDFLIAVDAYRAGDPIKLARVAKRLDGHLLAPWLEYFRLSLRLEDVNPQEVRGYLAANAGSYTADLLRTEWLKVLGKRGEWQEFSAHLNAFARDDLEVRCYQWLARLERGEERALGEAYAAWLEPRELPPGCNQLADALAKRGRLGTTQVWQRVRVLFEAGQTTAAKRALGYLPRNEAPDERNLTEAARAPQRLLARAPKGAERRSVREAYILAALRYARTDVQAVAKALQGPLGSGLSEKELGYLWGRVAVEGAQKHDPEALAWFAAADPATLGDAELVWKARAALRVRNWQAVRDTVNALSERTRRDSAWVYWHGRAMGALGEPEAARASFLRIAGHADYYSVLASEELGYGAMLPAALYDPTEEEVAAAAREPALARSLELIRLGQRTEGVREWMHAVNAINDDRRLLAAAELARRNEVYDRAIGTAIRTAREHNFQLRYPTPYQAMLRDYAKSHGVEEAWVFSLVRQESRFVPDSRSAAGARGLMQVMPHTASWVARQIGMRGYNPRRVAEVETNIMLGTGYLKLVMANLGHPLLASAAYNAGPNRAKRWRDEQPLEGAVYTETIPFGETRDYVKAVMAATVFYTLLLDGQQLGLKKLLGTVPGRQPGERIEEE